MANMLKILISSIFQLLISVYEYDSFSATDPQLELISDFLLKDRTIGVHLISKDACLLIIDLPLYIKHRENNRRKESKYLSDEKIHGHTLILTDQMGRVGRGLQRYQDKTRIF